MWDQIQGMLKDNGTEYELKKRKNYAAAKVIEKLPLLLQQHRTYTHNFIWTQSLTRTYTQRQTEFMRHIYNKFMINDTLCVYVCVCVLLN